MKKIILIKLLLSTVILSGQNTTVIKGFVKNIDIDTLIIAKTYQDIRYNGIEIPVQKGKLFTYFLKHTYIEEYSIVYKSDLKKGAWRPINFFPNGKTLDFDLYPINEYDKNKVYGDDLREKKKKYILILNEKFAKKGNEIYREFSQLKKESDEYYKTKSRLDSLNKAVLDFQYNYFLNDDSILGLNEYVYLLENAKDMLISPEIFKDYQEYYIRKYYDHPLTERAITLYTTLLNKIEIGRQYVDITLTDGKNISLKLSKLIRKKDYTILDLWSPWCGPCIRKSKILKQNYSKIKNNTQIIGVVGGVSELKDAENAINRLAYPWKNYVEISDRNNIWVKYGIAHSGGGQFLINNEGVVLAINPELEKLIKIINGK